MRDSATNGLMTALRELKMFGMAQAVGDLAEQGAPAFEAAHPFLAQLLKAESAEREVRAVAYQLKQAKFPVYRDLAGFEFAHSEVNEALVKQLGQLLSDTKARDALAARREREIVRGRSVPLCTNRVIMVY